MGLAFAGCFLGAGYVSGQELWQFFGSFGTKGVAGLLVAVALLFFTGIIMILLGRLTKLSEIDKIVVRRDRPLLRGAVTVLELLFLFGVGTIMSAGVGALLEQLFGLAPFIGSAVFIVICLCWADFKAVVIDSWIPNPQQQIAMFHTLFNVFTTALLIPFSRSLVKLSQFVIREKKSPDEFSVKYIDERILQTPAIALAQLIKEMSYMLEVAQRALDKAMDNFINRTEDEEPVRKDLREINFLSGKVTDYLIRLSEEDMSHNDELTVSSLYKVLSDIMRVADFSNNIMRYLRVAVANELYFSSEGLNEIKEMYSLVDELFKDVDYTFANRTTRLLAKIEDTESKTDKFKLQLQQNHLDRLKGGNCKSESSSLYVNLIGNIERVADHLVYIAQSVKE